VFVVEKKKIKGTGDYNLSVDRYREPEKVNVTEWDLVSCRGFNSRLQVLYENSKSRL
jgi:hypothetical protein